jgi:hypothetical protein
MTMTTDRVTITPELLAGLGGGRIAYAKPVRSDDIKVLFPNVPPLAPGLDLWALLAADGTPIMLADSREAVMMNAHEQDLEMVSIH